jgi:hypothetical protein
LNLNNYKKDVNKKKLIGMNSRNLVERSSNADENISYTLIQKEMNLSSLDYREEKEMKNLFHIKIHVKKTKVDALFNFSSQANLIVDDIVCKLGMEFYDHLSPYPLGWVNKDAKIKVAKQCKIKFSISGNFMDEVELDVILLDLCGVVFGIHYMHTRAMIVMKRENQYYLVKDGKSFIINAHKGKLKISLVSGNPAKVFIFLRQNQPRDELVRVKASLEECMKE